MHANGKEISARIAYHLTLHGASQADLAFKMRISASTLSRRLKNPLDFTVKELLSLCSVLKIGLSDVVF